MAIRSGNHQDQILDLLEEVGVAVDHGQIAIVSYQRTCNASYSSHITETLTIEMVRMDRD